jgi:ribonuclease HI
MPPVQSTILQRLRNTDITPECRVLYSDGSMVQAGTPECAMAIGVVDFSTGTTHTVSGRTHGHASSLKAELTGLLVTVVAMPPAQDNLIRIDNQDVVTQYQSLVANRNKVLPRKRQRATQAGLW